MKRIASAVIVAASFLQGCGGGGGGGGGGDANPPPQVTSYSLSASVSGLEGSLTLVANSETPVTFTSSTRATLARLPAGTAYTVSIVTQPELQFCTLGAGSGTLNADTTIDVTCTARATAPKTTVAGFEVARFELAGIELTQDEYSGLIDGSIDVKLVAVDGGLVMLMPPLTDGAYRLEVAVGDTRYPIDFTVATPALPAPAAQITSNFVADIESGLAALRADPELANASDWDAIDDELTALKNQIAAMSPDELEALARIIATNTLPAAAAAYASATRTPLFAKYDDSGCRELRVAILSNAIDAGAYLSWVAASLAVGVEFGPNGALVGVAAAAALYKFKAWPAMKKTWRSLKSYKTNECFWFQQLNFSFNLEERFLNEKPGRTVRAMAAAQETLTFNHKRTREYDVTGSGTLPDDLLGSVAVAAQILKYGGPFLTEDAKEVLRDWTASYTHPLDLSDFALSNISDSSIDGTLSMQGDKLRLRFQYLPNRMPSVPVDFTFTLSGNNQTWQIPARLNLIEPPVAHDDSVRTQVNETLRGELQADFADSFRITSQPVNGTLELDSTAGVYLYTPSLEFTGADSFQFVAINERGESQPATVSITVSGLCDLEEQGEFWIRTCYTDATRTEVDFVERLEYRPPYTGVSVQRSVQLIPGDPSSIRVAENHLYKMYGDLVTVSIDKADWTVLPGTSIPVERVYESAIVDYLRGTPTLITWIRITRNLDNMTGAQQTLNCDPEHWSRVSTTAELNPVTGALIVPYAPPGEYNIEGPCPKTDQEVFSFHPPIALEDIGVWRIWNSRR
jgi:hypothetical protein